MTDGSPITLDRLRRADVAPIRPIDIVAVGLAVLRSFRTSAADGR